MCIALCIYNRISAWVVSWMHLAHIQVAVHIYINCMMLSLWALSWGVYHTAASPHLLPSLREKIICLACLPARQIGENQPSWLEVGSPDQGIQSCPLRLFLLGVLWLRCTLTPAPCDSEGKNWFTVVYSGLQRGEVVMLRIDARFHLPSGQGNRETAGKQHLAFLLCSYVLQYCPQRYNKVQMLIIEAMHMNLAWNW